MDDPSYQGFNGPDGTQASPPKPPPTSLQDNIAAMTDEQLEAMINREVVQQQARLAIAAGASSSPAKQMKPALDPAAQLLARQQARRAKHLQESAKPADEPEEAPPPAFTAKDRARELQVSLLESAICMHIVRFLFPDSCPIRSSNASNGKKAGHRKQTVHRRKE